MKLHVNISVGASRRGAYIVSASTNRRAAAQIIVTNSKRRATASLLGLISGRKETHSASGRFDVTVENYLQFAGVEPGSNFLELGLETLRGPAPQAVTVLPDSGVGATTVKPDELRLNAPGTVRATEGGPFGIPFQLRRRGGRPDLPISVRMQAPRLRALGSAARVFDSVGEQRQGVFRLEAMAPGRYAVLLHVPRRYNQPAAQVSVLVAPRRGRHVNVAAVAATAAVAFALAVYLFRRRWKGGLHA